MTAPDPELVRLSDRALEDTVTAGAACAAPDADPDGWYPDGLDASPWAAPSIPAGPARAMAQRACAGCPVQQACLERTLRMEPAGAVYGIAGGLPPVDRVPLLQARTGAHTAAQRAATTTPDPDHPRTGGDVDDPVSRYLHGQHDTDDRAAVRRLHATHRPAPTRQEAS